MKTIKKIMSIPEYREKKEIYEILGYKEIKYVEKNYYAHVTFSYDENAKHYDEIRKIEADLNRKGPPFFPIILFVAAAFVFLSIFVILLAISLKDKTQFNIVGNSLGFLLPAFACLTSCVVYTYFYFSINKRILDKGKMSKEEIKTLVESLNKK